MTTIPQLCQALQTVLTTAAEDADAELHYTKRPDKAKFTASSLVQTLVFGWLAHPDASLEQLAQTAARLGVAVSPQAIDQRFTFATATLLQTVLLAATQHLFAADPVAIPVLQRFAGVYIHDTTTISLPDTLLELWPGCAGDGPAAALKCGVQFDLLTGELRALDLAPGRAADLSLPLQHAPLPVGSLRLADLGFYSLDVLRASDQAGGYWLSKLRTRSCIRLANQPPKRLLAFVQSLGEVEQWDGWVSIGQDEQVRARLLLQRVPQEVADQRRRRIRKEARDKGRVPSEEALALAAWTLLITNVPDELLSLAEALVVAKVRWQIEMLFKLWKSHGRIDAWRGQKPARIVCEVYAKLLAMLVQQWLLVFSCWSYPDRSLVKAAQVVRDHAIVLACVFSDSVRLREALGVVQRVLQRTARMNTRRTKPNTYQLLLALTTQDDEA